MGVEPYDEDKDELLVTGRGFTPGGEVYLAIYDQMGRQLYENRWVTASTEATYVRRGHADGNLAARSKSSPPAVTVMREFTGLCGASAMIRALDNATERWSNWQVIQPPCASEAGPASANDLFVRNAAERSIRQVSRCQIPSFRSRRPARSTSG